MRPRPWRCNKTRIEETMTNDGAQMLTVRQKLLRTTVAITAIARPIAIIVLSIPLLTLAATVGAQNANGPQTDVTLEDAIARALERNLDIAVERLNPQAIQVTRINRDIADIDLRQTMTNTVFSVENAYWELVYATETLAVQQQSLDRAETLIRDNEARVKTGSTAPIQLVQARAEAAVRRQTLAQAQQNLAAAELALKRLIVGGADDAYWTATLNPVDRPSRGEPPTDLAATIQGVSRLIETATAARELAEEQLAAEQSKFAAGGQTSFFVVQAQRDLAAARETELRAIRDQQQALVELERWRRTSLSRAGVSIVR